MAKGPGGFISGGNDPLNAPDAPTIDSVSAGVLSADVTFSAPADTGAGTVDSYVITAKQSDGTSASATASAAGTASLTLTAGGTTTFAAQAISDEYGPGAFSGFGNSSTVYTGAELYTWGRGDFGIIGDGTSGIDKSSPVQIGALTTWSQLVAGDNHTAAISTNGELYAWGFNFYGNLGDGTRVYRSSPVQIGALTNWAQISTASENTFAIKTDGTLWAWGDGADGKLGTGSTIDRSSPVQIGSDTDWAEVSIYDKHALALKTNGELYVWGENGNGELGLSLNPSDNRSSPVQLGSDTWRKVEGGATSSLAIKTNGTLWSWGQGADGRLGDNTNVNKSSPVQVGALTNWQDITVRGKTAVALKTDGTMYVWGDNAQGQLGLSLNTAVDLSSPVQLGSDTWSHISTGTEHCAAVKSNGTLWVWGRDNFGKLGLNTANVNRSSPTQVGSESTWFTVSAGGSFTAALDGTTS